MKIVQSFWSKPQENKAHQDHESRFRGGWPDKKYHYMSWALSCLQLRQFYDQVELVTDQAGKELLIDQLGLPYTKSMIGLDRLDRYDTDLWALGKLVAFGLQDEPFLHVDGDLFIWKEFPRQMLQSPLVAQHLEYEYGFYRSLMEKVLKHIPALPGAIDNYLASGAPLCAYNMGIMGGHDIDFIRYYSKEAISFVDRSRTEQRLLPAGQFNTIYEQFLFFCLVHEHKKDICLYSYTIGEAKVDEELKGWRNFCQAPAGVDLIHLYGNCKSDARYCEELELKLKRSYPDYHTRIMDVVRSQNRMITLYD